MNHHPLIGNPAGSAVALAGARMFFREKLTENASRLEVVLFDGLRKIQARHP